MRAFFFAIALSALATVPSFGNDSFSIGLDAGDTSEQLSFDKIQRFRADPQGELARIFSESTPGSYTTAGIAATLNGQATYTTNWWRNNFGFNTLTINLDGSMVVPQTLQSQFSALPAAGSLYPYTWNQNIGWAAHQYSHCLEADAGVSGSHFVAGAPSLGARFTDSGYTGWNSVAENVFRNIPNDIDFTHAGFVIDWGGGVANDGIQNPPGHRNTMLSGTLTSTGIGHIDDGWTAGSFSQTQHFGSRFSDNILAGYAFEGTTYDFSNALSGATVELTNPGGGMVWATTTADSYGGYTIDLSSLAITNGFQYDVVVTQGTKSGSATYTHSPMSVNQVNVGLDPALNFDFNANGEIDSADADILQQAIIGADTNLIYDVDGNEAITPADLTALVTVEAGAFLGDLNFGSVFGFGVDSTDLGLLLGNFQASGTGVTYSDGDIDANGIVNSSDLGVLLANFGKGFAASAVPEPNFLPLFLIALGAITFKIRRSPRNPKRYRFLR